MVCFQLNFERQTHFAVDLDSDEEKKTEEVERAAKRRKLTHFEDGDVQGDVDQPKQAVVIPMVVEHDWRTQKLLEKEKAGTLTDEERAKLALVMPAGQEKKDGVCASNSEKIVVEGNNTTDAEDADYKMIPIESFGLAILRGCNWKDGDGIGKNPQKVALRLPNRRPPGLGLGATPKNPTDGKKRTQGEVKEEKVEEIKTGSFIKVVDGRNKGIYGKVEARDDDSNSLFIRTAIGGKTIKVSQIVAVAVSAKEYERDSKCLSKSFSFHHKRSECFTDKADYDKEKERLEKERKKDTVRPSTSLVSTNSSSSKSKEYKKEDDYRKEEKLWARTDLLVRFIDEDYKKGRLFRQKVRIVDVARKDDITITDEKGTTHYSKLDIRLAVQKVKLSDINQSWLETVIPREIGDKLMIVSGKRSGKLAVMVDKDKRKEKVTARLVSNNDVVTVYFEDVCAVKVQNEEDYE